MAIISNCAKFHDVVSYFFQMICQLDPIRFQSVHILTIYFVVQNFCAIIADLYAPIMVFLCYAVYSSDLPCGRPLVVTNICCKLCQFYSICPLVMSQLWPYIIRKSDRNHICQHQICCTDCTIWSNIK